MRVLTLCRRCSGFGTGYWWKRCYVCWDRGSTPKKVPQEVLDADPVDKAAWFLGRRLDRISNFEDRQADFAEMRQRYPDVDLPD